jgi:acetyltransferase-like isoleucine patch superfamily enzyme
MMRAMDRSFVAPEALSAARRCAFALRLLGWRLRLRGRLRAAGPAYVGRGARLAVCGGGRVELGRGAWVGAHARLRAEGGTVVIGDDAVLGDGVMVLSRARVVVGAGALVDDRAALIDVARTVDDVERPIRKQPLAGAPIVVGERARVGVGAAVLPGVTVGPGAVIGAGAVVEEDVAAGAVVGGAVPTEVSS